MKLTDKQIRFCDEYVIDLNGTKAAIRAGYSKKTANEQAAQLLAKLSIKEKIKELQTRIAERNNLKADDVINELRSIAFWDIKDFVSGGNDIRDVSKLTRKKAKPIVGIKSKVRFYKQGEETVKEITTELKLSDKRAALVDLGKHLGIFEKDNNQLSGLSEAKLDKIIEAFRNIIDEDED